MENKHYNIVSVFGVPTYREGGGGPPVGTKSQLWLIFFEGSPKSIYINFQNSLQASMLNICTDILFKMVEEGICLIFFVDKM